MWEGEEEEVGMEEQVEIEWEMGREREWMSQITNTVSSQQLYLHSV